MVTLTGPSTVTAAAAHERMEKGPEALADYVRTGSQWQVTVMGRGAPERTHARVTEIPSMSEALRMALVVADRMFPPGTALLHTVAGDAEPLHDGAFSAMDLTARHPRTGELLSTVKFMVQTLAAAGELQRDLQRELTYDGLRAAQTEGNKGGRRPAVPAGKTDAVRTAYLEGRPSPPAPATTTSAAASSAPPSPTSCPSTPSSTRTPRPRSCRSSSTCRARSPTSSAPPTWSPPNGPRSTRG
ncbi:hypothetical protein [Streptomyces sioyaensis]|uniref:hypothetical protein n=1 Tax=Streptomyces sioyaensis TaxID=67364 RepID=UPI003790E11F